MTIRVARSRHGWAPGYFDALVGKRIPFPGGERPATPYTGILRAVRETSTTIEFDFSDVERER